MNSRVRIEVAGAVAHVQLSRPDKLNALDSLAFAGLSDAGERLRAHPEVRAVVLSGEGTSFCAGLDAAYFDRILSGQGLGPDGPTASHSLAERTHGPCNRAQHAALVWAELPVPVVAAIQGCCFGGGLQLALGADLRFAAHDARLSVMEIRWGLVPDMGGFLQARRLLRPDVFADLLFTGRQVDGEEAARIGLVTRSCTDPVVEAMAWATAVAARSPDAVRAAKRLLSLAREASKDTLLQQESLEQQQLIGSANQVEAILANHERRAPRFAESAA